MATTWDDVNSIFTLMLDDTPGTDAEFSTLLRVTAWNWAQRHFAHHTPRQRIGSLVVLSDEKTARLPDDFYEMGRLYDPVNEQWWSQQQWQPGGSYDTTWEIRTYAVWGGVLRLYDEVSQDNDFDLWYYAYWPDVEYRADDDIITEDKILVPKWAEGALLHLATAFCLQPKATQAAVTRQWNIKIDSGTPVQNSLESHARELMWWYNLLLGSYPPLDRGGQ